NQWDDDQLEDEIGGFVLGFREEIENIEPGFGDHIDYEIDEITNGLQSDYSEEKMTELMK
ncbi:2222_t:CDS:1, partial [Racocetra fulgida]